MTLLFVCKKELLELDFEGILKYFRVMVPKKCRNEAQAKKLMKMACDWKIKKLKKYEDDYKIKKDEQERIEQAAKQYELRFNEEKKVLLGEITHLHEKLGKASLTEQTSASIIADYKQIIQRHEQQIGKLNEMLEEITVS
jgi:Rab GTPase-activating protein 1